MKNKDVWQKAVNVTYELWPTNCENEMSYEDFISSLSCNKRYVIVLENLNYQIQNGGFAQWAREYYYDIEDIRAALAEIKKPAAREVEKILVSLQDEYEYYDAASDALMSALDEFKDLNLYKTVIVDAIDNSFCVVCAGLDERYHRFVENFENEVVAWVAERFDENGNEKE